MNTIVNLRGTNASGKSSAVRAVMEYVGIAEELKATAGGKTIGYRLNSGALVVGRYETACGGCDTIHTFREIAEAVTQYAKLGPVLFEGFLWSGIFKSSHELAERLRGQARVVFATMDTPVDECIRRVHRRRAAAGNLKPFDPAKLQAKRRSVHKAHRKLNVAGWDTRWLPYQNPAGLVFDWLKAG